MKGGEKEKKKKERKKKLWQANSVLHQSSSQHLCRCSFLLLCNTPSLLQTTQSPINNPRTVFFLQISLQTSKENYQAKEGREGEGKVRKGERERARGKMASEFRKKIFWRAVVAEFLAMSLFIFISIGSALGFNFPVVGNKTSTRSQDNVKVSLAFGLSIATMAQSVGHISGAHLNPAVTLGLLLSCQISIFKALMYILAQCLGAVVATAILSGVTSSLTSSVSGNSLGLNAVSTNF